MRTGVQGMLATQARFDVVGEAVLTTYDTDNDILRAVEAGAVGYLLNDAPREDLFLGVEAAARGESLLAPAVMSRLMGRMRAPQGEPLSPREIKGDSGGDGGVAAGNHPPEG